MAATRQSSAHVVQSWQPFWREREQQLDAPVRASTRPAAPPTTARTRLSMMSCRASRQPAGAERRADGELAAPRQASRQHQARHVRARDEQHAAHGAEQHQQARPARLPTSDSARGRAVNDSPRLRLRELAGRAARRGRSAGHWRRRGWRRAAAGPSPRSTAISRSAQRSPSTATGDVGTSPGASVHTSATSGWRNRPDATPRISVGMPFTRTLRPDDVGPPPNWRCHKPFADHGHVRRGPRRRLRIRPAERAASTRSTSKNAAVVWTPGTRTGSPSAGDDR